jgi:ribosomal protein S24E
LKLKIVKRNKNPLLKREEIEFAVEESKSVPSRKDVAEKIAAQTNAQAGTVVVKKIETAFGSKDFQGRVNVYESVEALKKVEPAHMKARLEGKKKEGEEKKEEKKEAPKEEKKEAEAKPEEKKAEKPEEKTGEKKE